ncbi:hypothetical protein Apa02nite_068160 [Actinoplanes palleronii]|uniref:Uncharacterized protein n=1 Tax=Actinoplanes palleronii TaxID=113570 RepID=A0ABQ4BJ79_9ACTN|nr:hypothetical protein Apa02nite_068160 [Actinoplanes palleronii]
MTRPALAGSGVHKPRPNGPLQDQLGRQRAIPPSRHIDPRTDRCVCGWAIRNSCWGWVHLENAWVSLGACTNARPPSEVTG